MPNNCIKSTESTTDVNKCKHTTDKVFYVREINMEPGNFCNLYSGPTQTLESSKNLGFKNWNLY